MLHQCLSDARRCVGRRPSGVIVAILIMMVTVKIMSVYTISPLRTSFEPWHEKADARCIGCGSWDSAAATKTSKLPGAEVYRQLGHELSPEALDLPCKRLLELGGKYTCTGENSLLMDGKKPVCFDPDVFDISPGSDCLVYSFGIKDDLSFEKVMAGFGCEVHAFDPTIEAPSPASLPTGLHVHLVGIDGRTWIYNGTEADIRREWPLMTLDDIKKILKHQNREIDFLKLDAEGSEWLHLQQQLSRGDGGSLRTVRQIHLEVHLMLPNAILVEEGVDGSWQHQLGEEDARRFLRTIVALKEEGYDFVWTKKFGEFPAIKVAHVYESLFLRRKNT